MMRILTLIVIAFSCCISRGADKTVTNKELAFEITFPDTWIVNEHPAKGTAEGKSPVAAGAKFGAIVILTVDEENGGVVTNVEKNIVDSSDAALLKWEDTVLHAELRLIYKNYEQVEDIETKLAGNNAKKFTFYFDHEHTNARYQRTDYITVKAHKKYLIQILEPKSDYEIYSKDIDAIVQSLKPIKKE